MAMSTLGRGGRLRTTTTGADQLVYAASVPGGKSWSLRRFEWSATPVEGISEASGLVSLGTISIESPLGTKLETVEVYADNHREAREAIQFAAAVVIPATQAVNISVTPSVTNAVEWGAAFYGDEN